MALRGLHHLHHSLERILLRAALRELQTQVVGVSCRRVEGFNLDYLVLNITGYGLYTIYSSVGYFTDIPGAGTVVIADLVFVYHGVLMVTIQVYQVWRYEVCSISYRKG